MQTWEYCTMYALRIKCSYLRLLPSWRSAAYVSPQHSCRLLVALFQGKATAELLKLDICYSLLLKKQKAKLGWSEHFYTSNRCLVLIAPTCHSIEIHFMLCPSWSSSHLLSRGGRQEIWSACNCLGSVIACFIGDSFRETVLDHTPRNKGLRKMSENRNQTSRADSSDLCQHEPWEAWTRACLMPLSTAVRKRKKMKERMVLKKHRYKGERKIQTGSALLIENHTEYRGGSGEGRRWMTRKEEE